MSTCVLRGDKFAHCQQRVRRPAKRSDDMVASIDNSIHNSILSIMGKHIMPDDSSYARLLAARCTYLHPTPPPARSCIDQSQLASESLASTD